MFTKKIMLSFFCVTLAAIMLFSSCSVQNGNAPITSEGDFGQIDQTVQDTSDMMMDSEITTVPDAETTDEIQTDSNGVIIEIQRPVAGAPAGDSSSETSNPDIPSTTEREETLPEGDENVSADDVPEESIDEEEDLPYADDVDVFVPYSVPMSIEDQKLVERIAARFNVHEELVFGVMWAESRYDRGAVGRNDRYLGVMQVSQSNLPVLEKYFGITDLMDFEQNVTAGCYYLGHYADMYDHNMNIMLLYYHGGYKYANPMIEQGILEDRYTREVLAEMDRIIEARKQTAAEMGVKLKGWLYEY